jgi:TetR/AcrR family transcriptional repressor of nem operon
MSIGNGPTHENKTKLLQAASRLFSQFGIHATSLQAITDEAGVSHGHFYSNFKSKEDLVRQALCCTLEKQFEEWAQLLGHEGTEFDSALRWYLSPEYRDHPNGDCVLASLSAELARHPTATRLALEGKINAVIELMAGRLPGKRSRERRRDAIVIYTQIIGALQLARLVVSPELSAEILTHGLEATLAQLTQG